MLHWGVVCSLSQGIYDSHEHKKIKVSLAQFVHNEISIENSDTETGLLTLKVLVVTIDAQGEGMGDEGSARYEPALLPPCPTIRVISYSN